MKVMNDMDDLEPSVDPKVLPLIELGNGAI
jgi:hypothetical protein